MKFIVPFIFLFIVSCQHDASNNIDNEVQMPEELAEEKKPEADYQCVAKVSGMVCKMGCGGAIRKKLTSLKGVSRVALDYEDEFFGETEIIKNILEIEFKNDVLDMEAKIYYQGCSEKGFCYPIQEVKI